MGSTRDHVGRSLGFLDPFRKFRTAAVVGSVFSTAFCAFWVLVGRFSAIRTLMLAAALDAC